MSEHQRSISQINKEILERIKRAKRFGYAEDEVDANRKHERDNEENTGKSRGICPFTQILIDLGEHGINAKEYEYYEAFRIAEDIRCDKLRKSIFECLGYLDKKKTVNVNGVSVSCRKQFGKDATGSDYSIHLSEILEEVNKRIEAQKD